MRVPTSSLVFLALIGINILWGINVAASKIALTGLPPFTFLTIRVTLALLAMLPFGLRAGLVHSLRKSNLRPFLLSAALGLITTQTGFAVALKLAPSALIAALSALSPLVIVIFAVLLLDERLTPRGWAGIATSFAGVLVVLGVAPGELGVSGIRAVLGSLAFLTGNISWGLYSILSKRYVARTDPVALATGTLLFGWCGLLLPFAGERLSGVGIVWSLREAGGIVFAAIATFSGFLGFNWALRHVESARAGVFFYIQPPLGVASSWLLLGERPGLGFFAGALLILVGVFLAAFSRISTLPARVAALPE